MEDLQFPAKATIRAFGGLAETARALSLSRQAVYQWNKRKTGLIPRWWTDRIKAVAEMNAVSLPLARKPKKRKAT